MSETKEEKRRRKEEKKIKKLEKKGIVIKKREERVRGGVDPEESNENGQESVGIQETEVRDDETIEKDTNVESEEEEQSKRKDLDEIEIDLKGDIPLNRKQQRLLKKGKLDLEKLKNKNPPPKPELPEGEEPKEPKGKFGVWIGNLSFDTIRDDIVNFITAKTDLIEANIKRVNLPKKANKIKGFCYVDFENQEQVDQVIGLSEQSLNGRNLLIKNASSFEGRPESHKLSTSLINPSKNPPSRILFVGNLSFDTTEDLLQEHFKHCGDIVRIRMATFEDSGKCKGFAFVDFKDETGPTNALTSKSTKKFINRPLRMEYGEDRSKRQPKRRMDDDGNDDMKSVARERTEGPEIHRERQVHVEHGDRDNREHREHREHREPPKREYKTNRPQKRLKSSEALASAQRASPAIVPSSGKKITFD